MLDAIGFNPTLLPPLVEAAEVADTITEEVATLTGLPAGTPVAGDGADHACGAVGNGVVRPGLALVSISPSGMVLAYAGSRRSIPPVPCHECIPFDHEYRCGPTMGH